MSIPFIDLKTQYKSIQGNIQKRINTVLDHGQYIMGPEIKELENTLAKYIGSKHAIACSSGTDALLMAVMALDIGPGDEVIVPDFSFFGTAEVVALTGARCVFVDVEEHTYNLDPKKLEEKISKNTKAIMPVSLYGQCANYNAINEIAKKYNVTVIEDGAQSFGATHHGKKSLNLTEIGCTSFFPSKPLGCYGDGGAVFTNDDELAERFRQILSHGQNGRYHHVRLGLNARMDSLQAAILEEKMLIFPKEVELRQKVANRYSELLHNDVITPTIEEGNLSVYAQYTIQVDNREGTIAKLKEKNIPTAVHYPEPLSCQPALKDQQQEPQPISARLAGRVMSLPMHPYLTEEDQDKVIAGVNALYS